MGIQLDIIEIVILQALKLAGNPYTKQTSLGRALCLKQCFFSRGGSLESTRLTKQIAMDSLDT